MSNDIRLGQTYPLGATVFEEGVNFCLFSKHAEKIELLLFNAANDPEPARVIPFDPKCHKTFYYWHLLVEGLKEGQIYAYRVYGPNEPEKGHRFDGSKVLLDPYAKAIAGEEIYDRKKAIKNDQLSVYFFD